MPIISEELPDEALLQTYQQAGAYTDCFTTEIEVLISQTDFVEAFYTTPLFKLERLILCCACLPSSDQQAAKLARGETQNFAAWKMEARNDQQLLMCDFRGRTRSWLAFWISGCPDQWW